MSNSPHFFRQKVLELFSDSESPYEYVATTARRELEQNGLVIPDYVPADLIAE
jgi:hypothetical protein